MFERCAFSKVGDGIQEIFETMRTADVVPKAMTCNKVGDGIDVNELGSLGDDAWVEGLEGEMGENAMVGMGADDREVGTWLRW